MGPGPSYSCDNYSGCGLDSGWQTVAGLPVQSLTARPWRRSESRVPSTAAANSSDPAARADGIFRAPNPGRGPAASGVAQAGSLTQACRPSDSDSEPAPWALSLGSAEPGAGAQGTAGFQVVPLGSKMGLRPGQVGVGGLPARPVSAFQRSLCTRGRAASDLLKRCFQVEALLSSRSLEACQCKSLSLLQIKVPPPRTNRLPS